MVGRPKTRLKRLCEVHCDLELMLGRLTSIAPQRASAETAPSDRVGLLWREILDAVSSAYLTMESVIELLDVGKNVAADGEAVSPAE